ncbi:iron-containing alcohol dehydrogenase [Anaerovorax odorimutans]|uniref:iron-containing alcohol dehydrogenase n=1 Tax=Anaerovorax odorimutans TaxID=109327 RepID=UPI00040B6E8E|nr:iron-containing alcohol dehydrogenase [Anaerovorax odorimutans]
MKTNMKNFDFILPTKIRFGYEIYKEIGKEVKELGRSKPIIITDKGLISAGVVDKITKKLEEEGIKEYVIFDSIEPNPKDITVQKAYEEAKRYSVDCLIAIGGGSSMDTAKAVGVLMTHGGIINDYEGLNKITKSIDNLIAIPTTVGTGSEVTFWSVITDTNRHYKMSIGSPLIAPKTALVDPLLVESLPSKIVASTGMDALTHAIEGYTCTLSEPITDACGIFAIKMLAENIRDAVYTDSVDAKAKMLLGSLIAGICFGNSDIAGVHCMAEALGGLYDTPHGIANAILLPFVVEYNFVSDIDKFAEIAKALGENIDGMSVRDAAYQSVAALKKLNKDLMIPTINEIDAKIEDIEELAKRASVNVSVGSNPRSVGEAEFLQIFKRAFEA